MRARALRDRLGAKLLEDYFVFTIERHPYDRAISRAGFELKFADYRKGNAAPADADQVIAQLRARIAAGKLAEYANWPIYTIDDRVVADAVILYEDMQNGLEQVLERLGLADGIDIAEAMPHLKGGLRPAHLTGDMLPADCRAAIQKVCAREFAAFGYRP